MNEPCKIVLSVGESLNGLPAWAGPKFITAVAFYQAATHFLSNVDWAEEISGGNIIFSTAEVPASEKSEPGAQDTAVKAALRGLEAKIKPESYIVSRIVRQDCGFQGDSGLSSDLSFAGTPFIEIPATAKSSDLRAAELFAAWLGRKRLEWLKLEYPQLGNRRGDSPEYPPGNLMQNEQRLTPADVLKIMKTHPELGIFDLKNPTLAEVKRELGRKKKILLHICCGPDAAGVINQLKRDFEVLCFWYDPNIQPRDEHDKRLAAFIRVAEIEEVPFVVGEYEPQAFYARIRGLEHTPEQGAKCSQCYDMRLERAAIEAKEQGCDLYSTTLAISPHKVQQKLIAFGELNEKKYGVPYYAKNFMKDEGFKKSVEYTRDYGIYRQDYCGCYFSLHEGGAEAKNLAQTLNLTRDALKPGFENPFLEGVSSYDA